MKVQKFFNKVAQKTHMPFFNDGTLIFCTSQQIVKQRFGKKKEVENETEYRPWKLACANWKTKSIQPIDTGLPENVVHCNPMFYKENGILHVSFIAGIPNDVAMNYLLYEMQGESWDSLSAPKKISEEFTATGFISPKHLCRGNAHSLFLINKNDGKRFKVNIPFDALFRATYDPEHPQRIIITGLDEFDVFRTLLFDTETNETREIKGPAPTYKACLVGGNRIVFSYRESDDLEDYQLCIAPLELVQTEKVISLEQLASLPESVCSLWLGQVAESVK